MSMSNDIEVDDSIYFYDEAQDYCFSLWRNRNEDTIEVMVSDQINENVFDIDVTLSKNILSVYLGRDLASKLDDIESYSIEFEESEEQRAQIVKILQNIFKDKKGLVLR
ncbi:hypothetical protein [Labrys neptuniae]